MKKLTTEDFIKKANEKYNYKYDYSIVDYTGSFNNIKIICPIHGVFEQRATSHLNDGMGCNKCRYQDYTHNNEYFIKNFTIEEDIVDVDGKIHCRCSYCKKYFTPTRRQLTNRVNSLRGKQAGENRLYCSDECKNQCPIFHKQKFPEGFASYVDTSRPVQPGLRQLTLERDSFECQKCGSNKDLHCHHFTGVETNPTESADIDNCITLCYNCHSRVHSSGQCDVRRQPCKV